MSIILIYFWKKLDDKGINSSSVIKNSGDMKNFVEYSDKFLDDSNKKVNEVKKSIERFKNGE